MLVCLEQLHLGEGMFYFVRAIVTVLRAFGEKISSAMRGVGRVMRRARVCGATSEMIRNCCYFGVISLVAPNIRFNEGVTRAVATRFSRGTIVNPIYPAPVNAYTSVTVLAADVVLTALGRLVPSKAVAASGTAGPHAISGLTTRTG